MIFFTTILPSAITIAMVFLFGCTGETIMEKAGHLNLGLPGIMCFGTFGGCFGISLVMEIFKSNPDNASYILLILAGIIGASIFGALGGLIYAFLTVSLKCNQNVTGLALTTFGGGFADYLMTKINSDYFSQASKIIRAHLEFGDSFFGIIGNIFLGQGLLVYVALILAIATSIVLKYTHVGLSLRSVGENPATADAAGINTTTYKYSAILIGSAIAGIGGVFYVMGFVGGTFENSATIQAFGWLALALVIFTVWKPDLAILGSIIFGILFLLPRYLVGISFITMKLLNLLPYIVTIIVLIVTSIIGKRSVQPPSSLGVSYFREER